MLMQLNLKKSFPYLGGFLGAVLLATAAFVGGYWYRGMVVEQPQPEGEVSTLPSPSPEMEIQVINLNHGLDMSEWITSTSQNLAISLKHPRDWYAMDFGGRGPKSVTPGFGLSFPSKVDFEKAFQEEKAVTLAISTYRQATYEQVNEELDNASEWLLGKSGYSKVERKKFQADNFTGLANYIYEGENRLNSVMGFLVTNNSTYRVSFGAMGEDNYISADQLKVLEQVVFTIKLD